MKKSIITFFLLIIPISVFADDFNWEGVWRGTIGKSRIVVCFHKKDNGSSQGSYYYVRYLTPIRLSKDKDTEKSVWIEENKGNKSLWTFDFTIGDTAIGRWSKPDGSMPLPIKLSRIIIKSKKTENDEDFSPCGCDEYNAALEVRPQVVSGKTMEFEGRCYKELIITSTSLRLSTIEISEVGPYVDSVNHHLLKLLPQSKSEWKDIFDSRRDALVYYGEGGNFYQQVEVVFWSKRFISVGIYGNYTVLDFTDPQYRTWDFTTGKLVNLWDWIKGFSDMFDSGKYYRAAPPEALNDIIHEYAIRSANCEECMVMSHGDGGKIYS